MSLCFGGPTLFVRGDFDGAFVRSVVTAKEAPIAVETIGARGSHDLDEVNPNQIYPLLIDRDIVVHGPALDEYIHERWPGPSLLPATPARRAHARMLTQEVRSWYRYEPTYIHDEMRVVEDVFPPENKWFLGDDVSVVDLALLPLFQHYVPRTLPFRTYAWRLSDSFRERAA